MWHILSACNESLTTLLTGTAEFKEKPLALNCGRVSHADLVSQAYKFPFGGQACTDPTSNVCLGLRANLNGQTS